MLDNEILSELKPTKCSLEDVAYTLKHNKELKENWNIFYVKDKNDVLRAVGVIWDGDGWRVRAYSVSYPSRWVGGPRVFSRNSFDTLELEPSSFEDRISVLEIFKDKVEKVLKI